MISIVVEDFDDVHDLLCRLRLDSGDWRGEPRDWVFRGQCSSSWSLTPSVARADLRVSAGPEPPAASEAERREAEWQLLRHFYRYSDAQGLILPGDSTMLRAAAQQGQNDIVRDLLASPSWPPPELHSLAALAQHYGVPTRLLDWTRKPLVAAYFAAEQAAASSKDDRLAIWALHRGSKAELSRLGIEFVTAPRGQIGNLHAQSGLFTRYSPNGDGSDSWAALDQVLSGQPGGPLLVKLTLPHQRAPELLWCLAANFVQATTVYSGYHAAWLSIRERRLRRRP